MLKDIKKTRKKIEEKLEYNFWMKWMKNSFQMIENEKIKISNDFISIIISIQIHYYFRSFLTSKSIFISYSISFYILPYLFISFHISLCYIILYHFIFRYIIFIYIIISHFISQYNLSNQTNFSSMSSAIFFLAASISFRDTKFSFLGVVCCDWL